MSEISFCFRRLRGTPGFTAFATLSAALGASLVSATFAATSGFMWTPIEVRDPDRVVVLLGAVSSGHRTWRGPVVSRLDFQELLSKQTAFDHLTATRAETHVVAGSGVSVVAQVEAVTEGYFEVTGVTPAVGRLLQAADQRASAAPVAVLSRRFWSVSFGGTADVVGRTIRIAGQPFEIVGVAAGPYHGMASRLMMATDAWIPMPAADALNPALASDAESDRSRREFSVLGRLAAGREVSEATAELDAVSRRLDEVYPVSAARDRKVSPPRSRSWTARAVADVNDELQDTQVWLRATIVGLAALILIIACTNLANLMLARATERRSEFAIRLAVGASRRRLVFAQLVESLLIAMAGGFGALLITPLLFVMFAIDVPIGGGVIIHLEPTLNWAVLLVLMAATAVSLAVFGLVPAMSSSRVDLRTAITAETPAVAPRWRGRQVLIALQVAVSAALFVLVALAADVLRNYSQHDSGIDVDRLAVGFLNLGGPGWTEARARRAVDRVLDQARANTGVQAIALASGLPFGIPWTRSASVSAVRPTSGWSDSGSRAYVIAGTPDLLRTLGIRLVQGRSFDERDGASSTRVGVVSEHTAETLFGTQNVLGHEVFLQTAPDSADMADSVAVTIIGVTRDTDTAMVLTRGIGVIFLPLAQHFERRLVVVARATGEPEPLIAPLRQIVSAADPDLAMEARAGTGPVVLSGLYVFIETLARTAGGFALVAMTLSMAGLYGLLDWLVARRRREIGIRMALGADLPVIRRMVLRDGLRPVMWGLPAGMLLGILARLAVGAVYRLPLGATEIVAILVVPTALVCAAIAACYPAATSAARIDPNVALRDA
jgi:predicted permease